MEVDLTTHTSEYLKFVPYRPDAWKKTSLWEIHSKRSGDPLGMIRWWGAWRQYVFVPHHDTLFNKGCMNDIIAAIDKLMDARKT